MQGLIHLYCGDGKGKMTAAVGLSVRAAGAGKRVLFAQFLKDGSSSELNILRTLPNVEVACCEQNFGFFKAMDGQTKAAARLAYSALLEDVMRKRPKALEVVLTGRDPSQHLLDAADYVTEMRKRKHPFDRGIAARRGVEF